MWKLANILDIVQINTSGVTVNLSNIIEKNIDNLYELFPSCNIDDIMDDIPNIFAGNVSEDWIERFVNVLYMSW